MSPEPPHAGAEGRILVTGASGNIGGPLLEELRRRGADAVAAVSSTAAAANPSSPFDFLDPTTWPAALAGVDRVFLLRPPALGEPIREIRPFIEAMAHQGVRHVAFLSVMGVNRVMPHWQIEQDLKSSAMGWTMLRPSFFMQNLIAPYGDAIRQHDLISEPAGRARFSFVDGADVAEVAAAALLDPDRHRARTYTLTGAEAVGYAEVATMLSEELQRTISYRPQRLRAQRRALLESGADRSYANVQLVINVTARLGLARKVTHELATILGRDPSTIRSFIAEHRAAWLTRSASAASDDG